MSSSVGQIFIQITYPKAILVSILFGGLYYLNVYDDGSVLQNQINEVRANIVNEEEKKIETDKIKAEEENIRSQLGALSEKFKEVTSRFPINLKSDEIITTINALAKATSVRVNSVSKEEPIEKELFIEVPLSIKLSGKFNNLLLLMYNIASLERLTNLGDFEFSNQNVDYDEKINLTTKVIGYKYRKPVEGEGEPASSSENTDAVAPTPAPASGGSE